VFVIPDQVPEQPSQVNCSVIVFDGSVIEDAGDLVVDKEHVIVPEVTMAVMQGDRFFQPGLK
jgi:hypothetical protein